MRLAEYYNLTPAEKIIQDKKARLAIKRAGEELEKKGIWNFPADFKKKLKKGEAIKIWNSL